MSAPTRLLEHVGVPYVDAEALVAAVAPRVADAVAVGDDVYLSVDRRTARGFREWLGDAADAVAFPPPREWLQDLTTDLRAVVRPGRRTLVLGQYSASGMADVDHLHAESQINLMLDDLPMTVLCSCALDAEPALLSTLRGQHDTLLVDGTTVPNPDFRPPAPSRPVSGSQWGPPTLRIDFRAPVDLARLREHVARAGEAVGLHGESLRETVLAAHEAAVVAAGGTDPAMLALAGTDGLADAGVDVPLVPCVLEVRAGAGVLHCEVSGPRPEVEVPPTVDDDPLHVVRMFCDRALLHDEADTRSVRVLRAPAP